MATDFRADVRGQEQGALTGRSPAALETIFALSSGRPPAGIAIVRVSGPRAVDALVALAGDVPPARRASRRSLKDADGMLLDRALVLWFPGPGTATGEDLAEFHLHGGSAVIDAVLKALDEVPGLRSAQAGEFTRRAVLNGRIDLLEAEGLADLLAAETEMQRQQAAMLADGGLSRTVMKWRARVIALSAAIEAAIDFSDEDDVPEAEMALLRSEALAIRGEVARARARPPVERLRDGVRVVMAGRPNAGKSTLLNRLVGREAAITSPFLGTTRDVVEVPVVLRGLPFVFLDTAGLRESADPVETIGIDRAREVIARADIVLWLRENDQGSPPYPVPPGMIAIRSKLDLGAPASDDALGVSAVSGVGVDMLVELLVARATSLVRSDGPMLSQRQRDSLREVEDALGMLATHDDLILVAEEARRSLHAFDRLLGMTDVEAVLDQLFGRFCVGK